MGKETIPTKMKSVRLSTPIVHYDEENIKKALSVEEVDVPVPKSGEVLVKMCYSTINPSDLSYMKGRYGKELNLPCGCGFEGSGIVVANGGGIMGWTLMGKRVALYGEAVWSEYAIVKAIEAIVVNDVPLDQAAAAIVNPITALCFIDIAKQGNHKTILHTAAASALGRMLIRLAKAEGIEVIAIIRNDQQKQLLKDEGCNYVFNSNDEDFASSLKATCEKTGCNLGFDAVGGKLSGDCLSALIPCSTLYLYGSLSGPQIEVNIKDLIYQDKHVAGFWSTHYLKTKGMVQLYVWTRKLPKLLQTEAKTVFSRTVTMDNIVEGLVNYVKNMSEGKTLIEICKVTDQTTPPANTTATDESGEKQIETNNSNEDEIEIERGLVLSEDETE